MQIDTENFDYAVPQDCGRGRPRSQFVGYRQSTARISPDIVLDVIVHGKNRVKLEATLILAQSA